MEGPHSQVKGKCVELTVGVNPTYFSKSTDFDSKYGRLHVEVENLTQSKGKVIEEHMSNQCLGHGLTFIFFHVLLFLFQIVYLVLFAYVHLQYLSTNREKKDS